MGYQVFLRIIRPLRFNYIENQIFVTLKQQPVLSLLTPAVRSPVKFPEPHRFPCDYPLPACLSGESTMPESHWHFLGKENAEKGMIS